MKNNSNVKKIGLLVSVIIICLLFVAVIVASYWVGYLVADKEWEADKEKWMKTMSTTEEKEDSFVDKTGMKNTVESSAEELSSTEEQTDQVTEATTVDIEHNLPDDIANDEMVRVKDYIPNIIVGLKYATTDNFTGCEIYDFEEAYLRYGTVKKLAKVQEELNKEGLSLKIWDAFRPVSAQFTLWEVCPDSTYVANPNTGYSSHSTGDTVDITLATLEGRELLMPTGFDDFSVMADRNYNDCSEAARENALLLENLMSNYGFEGYSGEWWHFSDLDKYSVATEYEPVENSR